MIIVINSVYKNEIYSQVILQLLFASKKLYNIFLRTKNNGIPLNSLGWKIKDPINPTIDIIINKSVRLVQ